MYFFIGCYFLLFSNNSPVSAPKDDVVQFSNLSAILSTASFEALTILDFKSRYFSYSFLLGGVLFSAQFPAPTEAIQPAGMIFPLLHLVCGAIGISCHPTVFCGKDKSIAVISKKFDAVFFLITKNKDMPSFIWIQVKLCVYHCNKSRDLFSKIRSPAGRKNMIGILCKSFHHNCLIVCSVFRSVSCLTPSGMYNFTP